MRRNVTIAANTPTGLTVTYTICESEIQPMAQCKPIELYSATLTVNVVGQIIAQTIH
jgi:hypothetical protein